MIFLITHLYLFIFNEKNFGLYETELTGCGKLGNNTLEAHLHSQWFFLGGGSGGVACLQAAVALVVVHLCKFRRMPVRTRVKYFKSEITWSPLEN